MLPMQNELGRRIDVIILVFYREAVRKQHRGAISLGYFVRPKICQLSSITALIMVSKQRPICFFDLHAEFPNLVGFKEYSGVQAP